MRTNQGCGASRILINPVKCVELPRGEQINRLRTLTIVHCTGPVYMDLWNDETQQIYISIDTKRRKT
jgi:hypothetical protein